MEHWGQTQMRKWPAVTSCWERREGSNLQAQDSIHGHRTLFSLVLWYMKAVSNKEWWYDIFTLGSCFCSWGSLCPWRDLGLPFRLLANSVLAGRSVTFDSSPFPEPESAELPPAALRLHSEGPPGVGGEVAALYPGLLQNYSTNTCMSHCLYSLALE